MSVLAMSGEQISVSVLELAGEDIRWVKVFEWQAQNWRVRIFDG